MRLRDFAAVKISAGCTKYQFYFEPECVILYRYVDKALYNNGANSDIIYKDSLDPIKCKRIAYSSEEIYASISGKEIHFSRPIPTDVYAIALLNE